MDAQPTVATARRPSLLGDLAEIYTRDTPRYRRARQWRFDAVLAHGPIDAAGNVVITVALAAIFADTASRPALLAWLLAINTLSLARLLISILVPRASARWRRRMQGLFSASLVAHGALWALALFLFAPADDVAQRSATLIWFAGSAAWVVSAYTLLLEAVLGFLVVQLVPIVFILALSGERFWQLLAVACAVFLPSMAMVAMRNNAVLMRGAITHFEKDELLHALEQEKRTVLALNESLEADIERREQVETDLREAKATAETLALELEKLSSLDGLTGIANRRRFDQTLQREWRRAQRARQPLALILCDIDDFKGYNDRYGHQAGDACLRQLAQLLESSLHRAGDLAARYGGEEFAILLPDVDAEAAGRLADAIRARLFELGLPHEGSPLDGVLTASFGIAALVPDAATRPDMLVRQADEALYAAKSAGRNRVQRAGERTLAPLSSVQLMGD